MPDGRSPIPIRMRRELIRAAACVVLGRPLPGRGRPPAYPDDTVTVVVPFPTGGATDQVARLLAAELNNRFGNRFIVENRAGASATIGTRYVALAQPDGKTLLYTTATPLTINPAVFRVLPYDPDAGFEPIALTVRQPLVVATGRGLGVRTLHELVERLRARGNATSYGSYGSGTASHIAAAVFARSIGATEVVHVPYSATTPPTSDLAEARLTFMIDSWSAVAPMVTAGKLQVLAVCDTEAVPWLPGVATVASLIGQAYGVSTWNGLFAPRGTPGEILDLLNREIAAAMAREAILQTLANKGLVPYAPMSREQVRLFVSADRRRWQRLIVAAGIERQ